MSFEVGFIKRAMQHGLCYRDAFELYKVAAPRWKPEQGVNQSYAERFATGFRGATPHANIPTDSDTPGFASKAWDVTKNIGAGIKNTGYDWFVAPAVDAVNQTGDAWRYARMGEYGPATFSAGKALGNAALTGLNFVPGLGLGAGLARTGLTATARGVKLLSAANKLRRIEQPLQRAAQTMGQTVLKNTPTVVRRVAPVVTTVGGDFAREAMTRDNAFADL
jgi:hypothetical protein